MKYIISFCVLLMAHSAVAQESEAKLFSKSKHIGGYGGSTFTLYDGGESNFTGEGAWIVSNFYFGGFGYGSKMDASFSLAQNEDYDLFVSAGGFLVGAYSNTENMFALFSELKVGFGDIQARRKLDENVYEEYSDDITTFTPMAGLAFTPIQFVQMRLYAGYQFSSDFELLDFDKGLLENPFVGVSLFVGAFNY